MAHGIYNDLQYGGGEWWGEPVERGLAPDGTDDGDARHIPLRKGQSRLTSI